jgi:hypothetical protein
VGFKQKGNKIILRQLAQLFEFGGLIGRPGDFRAILLKPFGAPGWIIIRIGLGLGTVRALSLPGGELGLIGLVELGFMSAFLAFYKYF